MLIADHEILTVNGSIIKDYLGRNFEGEMGSSKITREHLISPSDPAGISWSNEVETTLYKRRLTMNCPLGSDIVHLFFCRKQSIILYLSIYIVVIVQSLKPK